MEEQHGRTGTVAVIVRASVTRWVSDDQPGWVEVSLRDVHGRPHQLIEKVPVLTRQRLTSETEFPAELWLAAHMLSASDGGIRVAFDHSVETTAGLNEVTMAADDVVWL